MKLKRFEFNMFPVNCYLISDETKEAVIVDAGCYYPEEQQALKGFIADNGLQVKHLLNTHLHLDHLFGNAFVGREFGLKAEASAQDEFLLDLAEAHCRMFGFDINEPAAPLGRHLADGDLIHFGHSTLQVIGLPGHSPGGLAFHCPEERIVFSGDSLFKGSIGRTDLPGGSFETLRDSICGRLFALPDDTTVYPGHGDPTTIGNEKMDNPFFR